MLFVLVHHIVDHSTQLVGSVLHTVPRAALRTFAECKGKLGQQYVQDKRWGSDVAPTCSTGGRPCRWAQPAAEHIDMLNAQHRGPRYASHRTKHHVSNASRETQGQAGKQVSKPAPPLGQ